jgi:hypothetical protein
MEKTSTSCGIDGPKRGVKWRSRSSVSSNEGRHRPTIPRWNHLLPMSLFISSSVSRIFTSSGRLIVSRIVDAGITIAMPRFTPLPYSVSIGTFRCKSGKPGRSRFAAVRYCTAVPVAPCAAAGAVFFTVATAIHRHNHGGSPLQIGRCTHTAPLYSFASARWTHGITGPDDGHNRRLRR